MKDRLLSRFDEYLEKQDILNKLTEKQKLNEYGYSEIHTICFIKTLESPNVTEIANALKMTKSAISKIIQKLQKKGLVESYMLPDNRQKVFYNLTAAGEELYEIHERRHRLWEERDSIFFCGFDREMLQLVDDFMAQYNEFLENRISALCEEGRKQ